MREAGVVAHVAKGDVVNPHAQDLADGRVADRRVIGDSSRTSRALASWHGT